jgi:uncharacterized protein YciI
VKGLFAVFRSRGPAWNDAVPMDDQADWPAHAAFMDALVEEGVIVLGGPLEGTREAMLVIRAADADEIDRRLAADPWTHNGLLTTRAVNPWRLRLGSLP